MVFVQVKHLDLPYDILFILAQKEWVQRFLKHKSICMKNFSYSMHTISILTNFLTHCVLNNKLILLLFCLEKNHNPQYNSELWKLMEKKLPMLKKNQRKF